MAPGKPQLAADLADSGSIHARATKLNRKGIAWAVSGARGVNTAGARAPRLGHGPVATSSRTREQAREAQPAR
jgi:hypothetical protein